MSERLTLELPDDVFQQARVFATAANRRVEDTVAEWVCDAVKELPVNLLPNDRLLELCESELPAAEQDELSELLAEQREGRLTAVRRGRLDELLTDYRRGLVLKARALQEAVARGLRPPLNQHVA